MACTGQFGDSRSICSPQIRGDAVTAEPPNLVPYPVVRKEDIIDR